PAPVAARLARAEGVELSVPLRMVAATLDVRAGGRVLQGPPLRGYVAQLTEGGLPFEVGRIEGRLPDPSSPNPEVAVCRGLFGTRVPAPPIGDPLPMILSAGTAAPAVTGYFEMSGIVRIFPAIYANGAAMDAIRRAAPDFPEGPNLILLKTAAGAGRAIEGLLDGAPGHTPRCRLQTTAAAAASFRADSVSNLLSSMPLTLCLAALTASCLVSTILLIGLALHRRRIAELRCAGMTRSGVAGLVCCETLIVVAAGWLAGSVLGDAALRAFLFSERGGDLPAAPYLSWQAPAAGLALAAIVGLLSSLVPATAAMRVRPLEALGAGETRPRNPSWRRAAISLALLLPMALVSVCPWLDEQSKALAMALLGIPSFVAALLLSLQPVVCLAEALFLRPVARIARLDPALLRNRLGRDPTRVAGTVLTLALGLGGFIAIHVWGGTLMSSFVPSPEWPDAIVSILPNGWTDGQISAAARCPGVADGKILKIDCTQKPIDPDSPAFSGRGGDVPRGLVLLFGADPVAAFGGEHPFAPFRFVAGDREDAVAAMAEGRGCVIVSMLARMAGLGVGDRIRFAGRELEVRGVVDVNWHMVTSRSLVRTSFGREGARQGDATPPGRTASCVFVPEKFVRGITGNELTYFVWLRMTPELQALGGLQATVRLDAEIRAAVKDDGASAIQVHHRDEIADGTLAHGNDILGAMARIPFWSLAVASTGMVALLLASVQGRMRELRMMRAVGMSRGQLARLIFAEGLLVTLAALTLGLAAGILVGWSFTGLSRWMVAAGLPVRLIVPWATVARGVLFALALCSAMAALPLRRLVRMVDRTAGF
ncbi:MAG: ABC transporter permease, partial [Kiritimatiellae bacterium]|nr:ABC transporter permease [Kiritimatiellia bacterium]